MPFRVINICSITSENATSSGLYSLPWFPQNLHWQGWCLGGYFSGSPDSESQPIHTNINAIPASVGLTLVVLQGFLWKRSFFFKKVIYASFYVKKKRRKVTIFQTIRIADLCSIFWKRGNQRITHKFRVMAFPTFFNRRAFFGWINEFDAVCDRTLQDEVWENFTCKVSMLKPNLLLHLGSQNLMLRRNIPLISHRIRNLQ